MIDPRVSEENVPAYKIIEEKIRELDNTVIIARTYYIFDNLNFTYRFQLVKKDKMCMMDIPKKLLDDLKKRSATAEQEVMEILKDHILNSNCWAYVE
jgi:hypothetical protein